MPGFRNFLQQFFFRLPSYYLGIPVLLGLMMVLLATPVVLGAPAPTSAILAYGQPNLNANLANNGGLSASSLVNPQGVLFDPTGGVYISDTLNHRVLYYPVGSVTATRVYGQNGSFISNIANNGGISANSLNTPYEMVLDNAGGLYLADSSNNRVLYYPAGSTTATRVYGQGGSFITGTANNGGVSANSLFHPFGLALDSTGGLYVSDELNFRVLYYPAGSTTASRVYGQNGNFNSGIFNNGGVSANSLAATFGIAVDSADGLYVADNSNHRVLYYSAGSTTASRVYGQNGNFNASVANNGGLSANSLNFPNGLELDSSGGLYVCDTSNNRVLYYPAGSTTATQVYGQPGFNTNASNTGPTGLNLPYSVFPGSNNSLYVADTVNNRVLYYGPPLTPKIAKNFGVAAIPLNASTTLTFKLTNPNLMLPLTQVSFTDTLPTGLILVAPVPSTACGGTVSVPATNDAINLTGATIAPNASCSFSVTVVGTTEGIKTNVTGPISAQESGAGTVSNSAVLIVSSKPVVNKVFIPATINIDQLSRLQFTLINPGTALAYTNVSFTDNFPAQLTIATTPDLVNGCGSGTVSFSAGGNSVQVAGVNLAGGQSCIISLNVTSAIPGTWSNTTGSVSSQEGGVGLTSNTATLIVNAVATTAPVKLKPQEADLVGQLRVSPDRYAATDPVTLITYTLSVKNIGPGKADSVSLQFPLDPNFTVGFASFSDPRAWVSAIVTDVAKPYLQINLPGLEGRSQEVSATIVFRPALNASAGAVIFTRYQLFWDDATGAGHKQLSNAVRFQLSTDNTNRDDTGGAVQLFDPVMATVTTNTKLVITGDFYIPKEIINFWYTDPSGVSLPLGTYYADENGKLRLEFQPQELKPGETYALTGFGNRSQVSGSLILTVAAPESQNNP